MTTQLHHAQALTAKVCKVGVARDQAVRVGSLVEHLFHSIECGGYVRSVFSSCVFVFQTGREGKPDQPLLPFIRQGCVITISAAQNYSPRTRRSFRCPPDWLP